MPNLLGGSAVKSRRFRCFRPFFSLNFTRPASERIGESQESRKAWAEGKTAAWAGTTPVFVRLSRPNLRKLVLLAR
jgi:hypothetical protein